MNVAFTALNTHSLQRKTFGSYEKKQMDPQTPQGYEEADYPVEHHEERFRQKEGRGQFVRTEQEKDYASRKRLFEEGDQDLAAPPTQVEDIDPMDEDEEDYADLASLKASTAGKGPLYREIPEEEEEEASPGVDEPSGELKPQDDESESPDLHSYFMQFPGVAADAVVSMCRAYASYLASRSKKKLQGCLPKIKRRRK